MALVEALSIADYEAQRHILSIELVRVFFIYSILMQSLDEVQLGLFITDAAFELKQTVDQTSFELR